METFAVVLASVGILLALVVGVLVFSEMGKLRKQLRRLEDRLAQTEKQLGEQRAALAVLSETARGNGVAPDPLMQALSGLLELPARGLWPTLALAASRAFTAYSRKKGQQALPTKTENGGQKHG